MKMETDKIIVDDPKIQVSIGTEQAGGIASGLDFESH